MSKARSVNKVILVGNLTRDPSVRETSSGVMVATFGIATNTTWKDSDGKVNERAEFHNVVAFNKLAEICSQVLAVGMLVYVEGELRTRVKEDEGGLKQYRTEIKLNDMILLNSKDKKGAGSTVEGKFEENHENEVSEDMPAQDNEVKETKEVKEPKEDKEEESDDFSGDELF